MSNMYIKQCEKHSISVARRVFEALFPFLSFLEEDDSAFGRFYDQIFSVAVRLVDDIKASSAHYGYSQDTSKGPMFERKKLSRRMVENMIMINLKTGKIVKDKPPEIVVERILVISPALMHCRPGKNRKWLSKEIVGVEVYPAKALPSIKAQVLEAMIIDDSDTDNATVASLDASLATHHEADTAVDPDNAVETSPKAPVSGSRTPNTTVNTNNTTQISPDISLGDHYQTEAVADIGDTTTILSDTPLPCNLETEPTASSDKSTENFSEVEAIDTDDTAADE
ncbi:MAG: hypothetical protein Q9214_006345 [Letrouitia sp. 1 TL-2023]